MKKLICKTNFGAYEVWFEISSYIENNNLAILMNCNEGPFATLTVNLSTKCTPNCAFVDTNNCPWAEEFIESNKLGKPTGRIEASGWCLYPEYEFSLDKVKKYI